MQVNFFFFIGLALRLLFIDLHFFIAGGGGGGGERTT